MESLEISFPCPSPLLPQSAILLLPSKSKFDVHVKLLQKSSMPYCGKHNYEPTAASVFQWVAVVASETLARDTAVPRVNPLNI